MITKLDLMDEGTDARDVLENKLLPLRRGVCLFYCDLASFYSALAISLLLQFLRSSICVLVLRIKCLSRFYLLSHPFSRYFTRVVATKVLIFFIFVFVRSQGTSEW